MSSGPAPLPPNVAELPVGSNVRLHWAQGSQRCIIAGEARQQGRTKAGRSLRLMLMRV